MSEVPGGLAVLIEPDGVTIDGVKYPYALFSIRLSFRRSIKLLLLTGLKQPYQPLENY